MSTFPWLRILKMSATLVSIAVIFLLRRMNSKLTSPIVIMEIQEWQIDSVASFGMCIAFFLPQIITGEWFQPLIPYLDPILAIILSLFMLPVPIKTVITGLRGPVLTPSGGRNGPGNQRYRISDPCYIRGHKIIL